MSHLGLLGQEFGSGWNWVVLAWGNQLGHSLPKAWQRQEDCVQVGWLTHMTVKLLAGNFRSSLAVSTGASVPWLMDYSLGWLQWLLIAALSSLRGVIPERARQMPQCLWWTSLGHTLIFAISFWLHSSAPFRVEESTGGYESQDRRWWLGIILEADY